MHNKGLVSIIMPVYRTEEYVEACVRSILAQTYSRWELIAVDDGSPDGSGRILDRLAAEDSRIRVIRQANGGVSRARNRGLEEASGEWICFADSDDEIEEDYLSRMLQDSLQSGADLVCCGYRKVTGDGESCPAVWNKDPRTSPEELLTGILNGTLDLPLTVWNWLIPAGRIRGIRFDPSLRYGEDSLFICRVLKQCGSVYFESAPLYRYRTDRSGNTAGDLSYAKARKNLLAWEQLLELYPEDGPVRQLLIRQLYEKHITACRQALKEGLKKEAALEKAAAADRWKEVAAGPALSRNDRLRLRFYRMFPLLSEKIMLKLKGKV